MTGRPSRLVLACAADSSYAQALAVMLRSVDVHLASGSEVDVYAADDGLQPSDRERIASALSPRLRLHWVAARLPPRAVLPTWGRMPRTPFLKLTLADWLPPEVPRAIWLDCDLVVCSDLAELWQQAQAPHLLLAAVDRRVPRVSSPCGIPRAARSGVPDDADYFNAGVLVIDVERWRERGVAAAAFDYQKRFREHVVFWDQDALNVVLAGRWRRLEAAWNHDPTLDAVFAAGGGDGAAAVPSPHILHFCGRLKPWLYGAMSPQHALYFDHLDHTAWAGWRPRVSALRRLAARYSTSPLRRPLYPLEARWTLLARALTRREVRGGEP